MLKNIIKISKFAFSSLDKNPYTILGLTPLASEEEIKMAYFKLAKLYHPDIDPKYAEKFKEINEAYQILKDPAKRSQYKASQREQQGNNPYSSSNQTNSYQNPYDQYWQNQQSEDFYYRPNESPFRRYKRYPRTERTFYGFDPNNPFQHPDIKMRKEFRRNFMDSNYYQNDPWGRDPLSRSLLYLALVMSIVFFAGSMLFTVYASKKVQLLNNQRYEYYPVAELELDDEQQYY